MPPCKRWRPCFLSLPRLRRGGFEIIMGAVDITEMRGEIVGIGIVERGDVDREENAGLLIAAM